MNEQPDWCLRRELAGLYIPEQYFNACNTYCSYIQYVWGALHTWIRDTAVAKDVQQL